MNTITTPTDFQSAYQLLKANAQQLQSSQQPNIDELMAIVEQSIAAYKVCQTRIDAVERALNQAFDSNDSDA
ncbi:exodeoxyribonuclease VII small subunit [Faucicola atlantae]|uniref:exodeoxyribonuclease VII small subunit n=1 Tax=Faucicola atlantae TaxID=34059 RepID=UPI0025AF6298|nr:exodeoxyribonuclease VII small subunit [Moraxella atlantae]